MTRPWSEIRLFYARLSGAPASSMLRLVSAIEVSPYANGLFPWTSMLDLCIAQTPVEYPYDSPFLRISPISSGDLEFRYIDTRDEKKQWRRTVSAENAFSRLELFFDQLHWFTTKKSPSTSYPSSENPNSPSIS